MLIFKVLRDRFILVGPTDPRLKMKLQQAKWL